jgi:wyosine [tRNA(Phe)-imidazoG37] synthetase (radical SAM superfamily)
LATTSTPAPECPIASGPLKNERLGTVLGIDLGSQDQTLAVSRDNRMPRAAVVVTTAARQLMRLSKAGDRLDTVCVYGSKLDPTLHPRFKEVTENLRDLRNKWFQRSKLVLMSTEPHVGPREVRVSLGIYDRVHLRVEGGTTKSFAALSGRKPTDLAQIIESLLGLENIVVETRFFRGSTDTTTPGEVRGWLKRLSEINPREVQILVSGKRGSAKTDPRPAPRSIVEKIAADAGEKLGVPVALFSDDEIFTAQATAV